MKKINNKGFTLVELLAVLVVMIAITGIAIPSISSAVERSKEKQRNDKIKTLETAASLYATDHKNNLKNGSTITIQNLKDENYINDEDTKDANGNTIEGHFCYCNGNAKYSTSSCSSTDCES